MDAGASRSPVGPVEMTLAGARAAFAAGTTSAALTTIVLDRLPGSSVAAGADAAEAPFHLIVVSRLRSETEPFVVAHDDETAIRHRKSPSLLAQS